MAAFDPGLGGDAGPPRAKVATCFRLCGGAIAPLEATIAAEVPVALVYNGIPHVVMMATPADLEDFALGFSLSEGLLATADELQGIEIVEGDSGIEVRMQIAWHRLAGIADRDRNLTGRTGCGLCGVNTLTQVTRPIPRVESDLRVGVDALHRALADLPVRQTVNRQTGAVHAAAWVDPDGNIRLVREDVGRHNALDKLIGALARTQADPAAGFAVITSRCSFEMVQKAAVFGIAILVAISAPTTLALKVAEQSGVTLVALARADSVNVYANPGRIRGVIGV